jgi:hypothetical protein
VKLKELFEVENPFASKVPIFNGNIIVPEDCSNFNQLSEYPEYEGYVSGCKVYGNFLCHKNNKIKSMDGAPSFISGFLEIIECSELNTLKGCPEIVDWYLVINNCPKLGSLDYAPLEVGSKTVNAYVKIVNCKRIKSLTGIGTKFLKI